MILTCPECATRYQTDAAAFVPDGRKVRCAKCGHVWFQASPEPAPEEAQVAPEPDAAPEPVAAPRRESYAPSPEIDTAPPPLSRRSRIFERLGIGAGWALLAAIVIGIGWSGFHYRQSIAGLWPQSSSLYAALGAPVNTRGLEFQDKTARYETDGDQNVLVITGHLVNTTARELSVPSIRVSLMDAGRHELYHWNFSTGVPTLGPGKLTFFHTQLTSPPTAARNIELRLAAERSN